MSFWSSVAPALGGLTSGAAAGGAIGGPWGAAIGGGLGLLGGLSSDNTNQQRMNDAQNQSIDNTATQRNYETQMSNTAHQREVADLKAAGLNPVLSASGGPGASTPGVGSAGAQMANKQPSISFPDVLQAKALEQKDTELGFKKSELAAYISKNDSDVDLNKMEKLLKGQQFDLNSIEQRAAKGGMSGIDSLIKSFFQLQKQKRQLSPDPDWQRKMLFEYDQLKNPSPVNRNPNP